MKIPAKYFCLIINLLSELTFIIDVKVYKFKIKVNNAYAVF
jgi:hypothetical protein